MTTHRNTGTTDNPTWKPIVTKQPTPPSSFRSVTAKCSDGTTAEAYYTPWTKEWHRWQKVTDGTKNTPPEWNWVRCDVVSWTEMQGGS